MNAQECTELPPLAWCAELDTRSHTVEVYHGSLVEAHGSWIVEGVWSEDFEGGGFPSSEHFFGSGVRVVGNEVVFVPSSALVDRILYCTTSERLYVSNSLVVLLAVTGARLKSNHDYDGESYSVLCGIDQYDKRIPVKHPEIRNILQQYHDNLVWLGNRLTFERRTRIRSFESYEDYVGTLLDVLERLKANFESPVRKRIFRAYSTLSAGYDSPAVACLARSIGVGRAFSARRSSSTIPAWLSGKAAIDDGAPIGELLGLEVMPLDTTRSSISTDEAYFLAASTAEPELVFHSMTQHIKSGAAPAVVFTGYHGDKMWDRSSAHSYLSGELLRGDTSGLNLSEIRLESGFVNVAVPFIDARSIRSVVALANSSEMAPWALGTEYDRPIPRRILETAGVPRDAFGTRKRTVIDWYNYPRNTELRQRFFRHMLEEHRVSASTILLYDRVSRAVYPSLALVNRLRRLLQQEEFRMQTLLGPTLNLPQHLFFWATCDRSDELMRRLGASGRPLFST